MNSNNHNRFGKNQTNQRKTSNKVVSAAYITKLILLVITICSTVHQQSFFCLSLGLCLSICLSCLSLLASLSVCLSLVVTKRSAAKVPVDVEWRYNLWKCQILSNGSWHPDLVDTEVGIGRDNCTS